MAAVKCSYLLLLIAVITVLLTLQMMILNNLYRTETEMKSHDLNDSSHRYRSVFMLPASLVIDSLFPMQLSGDYASQYVKTKQLRSFGVDYEHISKNLRSSLQKDLRIITINYNNLSFADPFYACLVALQWDDVSTIGWKESVIPSRCRNFTRTVVVYQSCTPHLFPWVSHHNIYEYYDSIIACGKTLSAAFPDDIIAWQSPSMVIGTITKPSCDNEAIQEDLGLLHRFLIDRHVRSNGIIVLVPSPDAKKRCSNHGFDRVGLSTSTKHNEQTYSTIMDDLTREVLRLSSIPFNPYSYSDNKTIHDADWCTSMLKKIKMDQKHLMNPSSVEHDDLSPLCSKYVFTRKFHPHCHPPSSEVRAILVTGLGGSGTHFIANHLRRLGYRLHHEGLDDDGAVVSSVPMVSMSTA